MSRRNKHNWTPEDRDRPHHNNKAWQLGKSLSLELYRVTSQFPDHERYGLVAQIRRAGVSIPSNIAEGKGRRSDPEFLRYLYMARGSLEEIDTQMEIADDLGYLDDIDVERAVDLVENFTPTLEGLIQTVREDIADD
ncbi:MAG: four helix bundle protein [Bradymonadaceae bacterium]